MCINHKFEDAAKTKIPNTLGVRPKTFEIDALVDQLAFEIKWRDATTDGDHDSKRAYSLKGYPCYWIYTYSVDVLLPK